MSRGGGRLTLPVCDVQTKDGAGVEHVCRRIRGHQGPHACNCSAPGLPVPHRWDVTMTVLVGGPPETTLTTEQLEDLLAHIAAMYGSGCDEYGIARTLHVTVAFVRHVLGTEDSRS
jgi:hypothetical protein